MTGQDLEARMRRVLSTAARRMGLNADGALLLRLHSNAIFALPRDGLVVRIATNPNALPAVTTAVTVTRWLAARDYPCTIPGDQRQPLVVDGLTVTTWRYLRITTSPAPTAADLGRLLRLLHHQPDPPAPPSRLTDPLVSVAATIDHHPEALGEADLDWLRERITALRTAWRDMTFPRSPGLIHGDAHDHNLMRTSEGSIVLGDWDHVALGPREWDLVQPHYTHRRFHRPDDRGLDEFAETYGWDIRDWRGLDTLIAVRELTGLAPYIRIAASKQFSATEIQHRLSTLRNDQTHAQWTAPQS